MEKTIRQMLSKKQKIILVIVIAVSLNAITFCLAFPETFKPESTIWARDFSAYYIGEWRLFHNPTTIYWGGVQPGDYQILPAPQTFKYAPSFLILFAPFLALSYQNAFTAFDIVQLALIPALAFFVYKIVKDKNYSFRRYSSRHYFDRTTPYATNKSRRTQPTPVQVLQLESPVLLPHLLRGLCLRKCPRTSNHPLGRRFVLWIH